MTIQIKVLECIQYELSAEVDCPVSLNRLAVKMRVSDQTLTSPIHVTIFAELSRSNLGKGNEGIDKADWSR